MTVGQAMYNYASLAIKRGVVDARCEALHAALYYLPEQISNLVIGEPIKIDPALSRQARPLVSVLSANVKRGEATGHLGFHVSSLLDRGSRDL